MEPQETPRKEASLTAREAESEEHQLESVRCLARGFFASWRISSPAASSSGSEAESRCTVLAPGRGATQERAQAAMRSSREAFCLVADPERVEVRGWQLAWRPGGEARQRRVGRQVPG